MKLLGRGGLTSVLGLYLTLGLSAFPAGVRTMIWTGAASTDRWTDAGNWTGDVVPGSNDIARFESQADVVLEGASSVGRLEVELADKDAVVYIDGAGKLVLTGVDTVIGKPLSLAVKGGTLEIGPELAIDLEGTRFSAQAGGTLVLRSEKIVAQEPYLKAAVSQSGTLRLGMRRWDPQMDLDLSTGTTRGRGAKVIDFALSADVHQIITFKKFKEHDGDPIVIRGFEPGDALCFSEDPRRSTDPGKKLVLSAVGFEGWGAQSAAGIESTGALWCLKPKGTSLPKAVVELSSAPPESGFRPRAHLKDMHVQTLVAASERYPRNMGADMVKLRDGRYFLAFSQWLTGMTDQDDSRVMGMVSSDQGVTWGAPFPVATPDGECRTVRQPSLLRRGDGELLLFVRCRKELTEAWVALFRCRDEERIDKGLAAWTRRRRITPAAPGRHIALNNRAIRLSTGRLLLPLSTPWPWDRPDVSGRGKDIRSWCLYSDDDGETWQPSRSMLAGPGRGLMEPYAVELKDGRLLMLMRTQTHRQYRSISPDGGDSWSPATEVTSLVSPESPAAVRRDPGTGWLSMVWNYNSRDKHGADRTPLTIAFSDDEGESWFGYLNLESDRTKEFSYPSLRFIDGKVFVTYYERQIDPTDRRISLKMRSFNISAPGLTARGKSHAGGVTPPEADGVTPSRSRDVAPRSPRFFFAAEREWRVFFFAPFGRRTFAVVGFVVRRRRSPGSPSSSLRAERPQEPAAPSTGLPPRAVNEGRRSA